MFSYIDAIILVLFALCILIGIWRGFFRSITKFCGLTVKLIISFILCKPIAKFISKITSIDEHMFDKYSTWASGLSDNFNVNLTTIPDETLNDFINNALADSGVPKIFRGMLRSTLNITPESISSIESITLAELVGEALKNIVLIASCFIVVFIVLCVVIFIVNRLEKRLLKTTRVVSKIDRGLGGVVGAFRAFMYIFSICLILSLFRNVILFESFFESINTSAIGGPLTRLMFKIIDSNIDFNKMIFGWLESKLSAITF